jgi:hypothetical protein
VRLSPMNRSTVIPPHCECGEPIEPCVSCADPRCPRCEPYVSDDCVVVFATAS